MGVSDQTCTARLGDVAGRQVVLLHALHYYSAGSSTKPRRRSGFEAARMKTVEMVMYLNFSLRKFWWLPKGSNQESKP